MTGPSNTLPAGSRILVTGATGFIASHVVLQFLQRGYKVRGSVRDLAKAKWLVDDVFASYVSKEMFELVHVPDMAAPDAFDEAIKGVSAVAHVATINTWDSDPNKVIPQTVAGVENALSAAARERSVKQFVYTSTVGAAAFPMADTEFHVDADAWNDAAVDMAWAAKPPYDPSHGVVVYLASKVAAERAVWKFAGKKPGFVINTVNPFTTLGPLLHEEQNPSTDAWVFDLCKGVTDVVKDFKALWYINVRDVATMHVAAILDPDVSNKRIHAWSAPFNWNDILAILRRLRPEHKFIDDMPGLGKMLGTVDDRLGVALMKKWAGQDGWTGLEEGIRETIEGRF